MEKSLNSRFAKVAKRFGSGIASIFTKGGPIGIAIGFLTQLLNPLQAIQESMERTLNSAGGIVSNAEQFGTSPGQLAKLTALGQAKGLEEDALYMLISKFQSAVVKAETNPNEPSAVREFVGSKDMAEGFFQFIQSLQKLDKGQQILAQQQVFGEKQVLKMADFLQTDFGALLKQVAPQSTEALNKSFLNLDEQADLMDTLKARRNLEDFQNKGNVINSGMIRAQDQAERAALSRENKQLKSYEDLNAISTTMTNIMGIAQEGITMLGKLVNIVTPQVDLIVDYLQKLSSSSIFRGIFKSMGKGD